LVKPKRTELIDPNKENRLSLRQFTNQDNKVIEDRLETREDRLQTRENRLDSRFEEKKIIEEVAFRNPCIALANGFLPMKRIKIIDNVAIYSKNALVDERQEQSFIYYAIKLKKLERILPTLKPLCVALSRNPNEQLMIDIIEYLARLPDDFDDDQVEEKLKQLI